MINPNWSRWIRLSIYKHFDTLNRSVPLGLNLEFETQQHLDAAYVGIRVNGPSYKTLPNKLFELVLDINALVQTIIDKTRFDVMEIAKGKVESIFKNSINLYKLGDGLLDDGSSFGCMQQEGRIITTYFGKIDFLEQSTVEAQYVVTLQGE